MKMCTATAAIVQARGRYDEPAWRAAVADALSARRITRGAAVLAHRLLNNFDWTTGVCRRLLSTLAVELAATPRSVSRWLRELVGAGLIHRWQPHGRCNWLAAILPPRAVDNAPRTAPPSVGEADGGSTIVSTLGRQLCRPEPSSLNRKVVVGQSGTAVQSSSDAPPGFPGRAPRPVRSDARTLPNVPRQVALYLAAVCTQEELDWLAAESVGALAPVRYVRELFRRLCEGTAAPGRRRARGATAAFEREIRVGAHPAPATSEPVEASEPAPRPDWRPIWAALPPDERAAIDAGLPERVRQALPTMSAPARARQIDAHRRKTLAPLSSNG